LFNSGIILPENARGRDHCPKVSDRSLFGLGRVFPQSWLACVARILHDRRRVLVVQAASLQLGNAGRLPTLRIRFMHNPR